LIFQRNVEQGQSNRDVEALTNRIEVLSSKQVEEIKKYEDEIERYQKMLNSKENSLSQNVKFLESQVSVLNAKNHALTNDLSQTIIRLEETKNQLNSKDSNLNELKAENERLHRLYNELNVNVKQASSEKNSLIAELQVDLVKQTEKYKQLETQFDMEIERITKEVDQIVLKGVSKERAIILQEKHEEISKLDLMLKQERDRKLDADREIHELQIKNITLSREITELKGAIVSATDKLNSYEVMMSRNRLLEKEILDKGAKIDQINKTLDEFQKIIQREQLTHNSAMSKVEAHRDKLERELEYTREELTKMHTIVQQHESSNHHSENNYRSRVFELEAVLKSKEEEEFVAQGKLKEAVENINFKESRLNEALTLANTYKQDNEINVRINEEQKLMIERMNKRIEELQIQMSLQRRSSIDAPADSSSQGKEIEELQTRFREALSHLGHIRLSAAKLEAEMESMRRENLKLKKALYTDSSRDPTNLGYSKRESIEQVPSQEGRSRADSFYTASNDIKSALDKAYSRVENLQHELLECKTDLHIAIRHRNDKNKQVEYYQNQIKSLTDELSSKNLDNLNLKDRVSRLELESFKTRKPLEHSAIRPPSPDGSPHRQTTAHCPLHSDLHSELTACQQRLEESELACASLQSQLEQTADAKNRISLLNSHANEELARARRKADELEGVVQSLRHEYSECKAQLATLRVKLLNIESKSSVQNINYEEILKERETELQFRDQMIEQLSRDCDELIAKMRNDENFMVTNDAQVEKILSENRLMIAQVRDLKVREQKLLADNEILSEFQAKFKALNGDSGSFDSIMQANALKERQLQMKVASLEQRVGDLQAELAESRGVQRRESVYREEAERFRLMYNDSQRELIKLKDDLDARPFDRSPYRPKPGVMGSHYSPKKSVQDSPSPDRRSKHDSRVSERDRSHLNNSVDNYRLMNDSRHSDN
jgi:chromosome segregation ATPase